MNIEVLAAGLATTVQDLGRTGFAALGVSVAGAADTYSLRVANLLAGNDQSAAALEISLLGPTLRFVGDARVAMTGADIHAQCDGVALRGWRAIDLPAGSELQLGGCRRGARSYLAVLGGVQTPRVMGSRATDLRGGFGGLEGHALRQYDRLPIGPHAELSISQLRMHPRWVNPLPDLDLSRPAELRILPGSDALDAGQSLTAFVWTVDPRNNRQGIRLRGPDLTAADSSDRVSEPVMPGTIQLPPDGQPIILGVDAQTVGGYPRIAHVIRADWPRMAQLRSGDPLTFVVVNLEQAEAAWRAQCARLARIQLALSVATNR
ncbi:MAG: biotin-dependent carboxyltransferase family protein [Pseudomarimonas sp.]